MSQPPLETRSTPLWGPGGEETQQASSLYRTDVWRLGLWAATKLPVWLGSGLSGALASTYWWSKPQRRRIVVQNLLPAVHGDLGLARSVSRELFRNFAAKIVDLWRYEGGLPIEEIVSDLRGWDFFAAAQARGRGVLLITAHLGNWELGAPLLAARGVNITVVTLDEPHPGLTELRQSSRARWGIETLVIGRNPFASGEIIRRLDAGGTVALLVDRPPPASAAQVSLFGRPFLASVAAAELARASGCVLLPVCLPRIRGGYRAEVFPEIAYDRASLGTRQSRMALTQTIMGVFELPIRQYLTQWYHFIPIWPA